MGRRNVLYLFLVGIMSVFCLAGCGEGTVGKPGQGITDKKETVTIAFWSDQLTERYGKYLQETFPDINFEFYVATNSTDFYHFKEETGDLPDILTVRRFSLNDVASWKDSLMDLSASQLAGTFPQSYLRDYTYSDGTVNWLPVCAEVDSIIVNKSLLEANGLSVPTNYKEFIKTCTALKGLGIRPFSSNFEADYTCMEVLQGFSISVLASQEGREWRQQYESGQTDELDEKIWLPVFERMEDVIDYGGISESDLEGDTAAMFAAYNNHQVAMIRGTSGEAARYGAEEGSVLMPYYGETEEESWYLTYPAFQVAASKKAEENPERRRLILDIMSAMLNEKGLKHIGDGQNMIPYNKGVELEFSPMLSHMQPYIDNNRLYIRLASADMFSVSKQVVQGMITGEYPDARSAFEAFNVKMKENTAEAPIVAHIEAGYSYAFDPGRGSPAASAVMNSLREELGTQLLIGQSVNVAGNIRAGDYTEEELKFLTMGEAVDLLFCEMTGEQLYSYMEYVLTTSGRRGSVINDSTLYVSSGFEMEIEKTDTGYKLEKLTIEGRELDKTQLYFVAVLGNEHMMLQDALTAAGVTEYEKAEMAYKEIIVDRLVSSGKQLAAPTDYITLR